MPDLPISGSAKRQLPPARPFAGAGGAPSRVRKGGFGWASRPFAPAEVANQGPASIVARALATQPRSWELDSEPQGEAPSHHLTVGGEAYSSEATAGANGGIESQLMPMQTAHAESPEGHQAEWAVEAALPTEASPTMSVSSDQTASAEEASFDNLPSTEPVALLSALDLGKSSDVDSGFEAGRVALILERLAMRVRNGEIPVDRSGGTKSDAGILASVLATLLAEDR